MQSGVTLADLGDREHMCKARSLRHLGTFTELPGDPMWIKCGVGEGSLAGRETALSAKGGKHQAGLEGLLGPEGLGHEGDRGLSMSLQNSFHLRDWKLEENPDAQRVFNLSW